MKRLATALLFVLSAGATALAAEFVVRRVRPELIVWRVPPSNPFWVHDPDLGLFHRPGQVGILARPEFSHRVTINRMGFRDGEWRSSPGSSSPADPGAFRIAVLGDSFVWGQGVEDDEVFTRLLEGLLPGVEAWNLGVSAYSTDQELILFRKTWRLVRPDLVLVMVSRNDFEGNVSESFGAQLKPRFEERGDDLALLNVPVPPPSAARRGLTWLRCRSAFVNGLLTAMEVKVGHGGFSALKGREAQIRITLRLLDEFVREASATGARFAAGLVPGAAQVNSLEVPAADAMRYDAIRRWGRERGVPVLDLVPVFRDAYLATRTRYYWSEDWHWNAAGHRLAAEAIASMLMEARLVPETSRDSGAGPEPRIPREPVRT